jgi:hypothetical protein
MGTVIYVSINGYSYFCVYEWVQLFLCLCMGSYFNAYEWIQLFLCLVNGSSYFCAYEWVQFLFVPSEWVQL